MCGIVPTKGAGSVTATTSHMLNHRTGGEVVASVNRLLQGVLQTTCSAGVAYSPTNPPLLAANPCLSTAACESWPEPQNEDDIMESAPRTTCAVTG